MIFQCYFEPCLIQRILIGYEAILEKNIKFVFRNKNSLGCHIWRFHKRGRESTPRVADSPVALQAATAASIS